MSSPSPSCSAPWRRSRAATCTSRTSAAWSRRRPWWSRRARPRPRPGDGRRRCSASAARWCRSARRRGCVWARAPRDAFAPIVAWIASLAVAGVGLGMDLFFVLLALLLLAFPIIAIAALVKSVGLGERLRRVDARLVALERGIAAATPPAPAPPTHEPIPPAAEPTTSVPEPETPAKEAPAPPEREPPIAVPIAPPPQPAPIAPRMSLEERLGTQWAVWVGGLAVVLGGIFLVRYSIEQGLLDRVAHEKDAAEYYSKATDPDRPLRSEALFEAHPWRDGRGLWGRRDGHGDGRLALGRRRGFLRRCLRLGHRGRRLGCRRNRFMRRRRGRGRRGRRYAALERGEPRFDATQVLAEPDRLHQGGDGDDREREQQQREQDEE